MSTPLSARKVELEKQMFEKRTQPDVLMVREYLTLLLDEVKDKVIPATGEALTRLQGRGEMCQILLKLFERQPLMGRLAQSQKTTT